MSKTKIFMRNIIISILVFLILLSCSHDNINRDLLGNWKSTESSNIVYLKFFKDSLISTAWGQTTEFSWRSDESKIYYTQITNYDPELKTDFILDYRLNSEKDTLYLKSPEADFTTAFIKTNN